MEKNEGGEKIDPEIIAGDSEGIEIARVKNLLGRAPQVIFGQVEKNIPAVYERPGTWPPDADIARLPSIAGLNPGPQRSVHPQKFRGQSQTGSTWNLPPFTWSQQAGDIISQILSQRLTPLRDRLTDLTRR